MKWKAGYKVYWYRGGLDAWKGKGLPMVPTTPIGAVMANAG
jgi:rhodanese-related sulfurtransferase